MNALPSLRYVAGCSLWFFAVLSVGACNGPEVHREIGAVRDQVAQLSRKLDEIEEGIADVDARLEELSVKASVEQVPDRYERHCTTVRIADAKTPGGPDIVRLHEATLRVTDGDNGVIVVEGRAEGREIKESKTFASAAFVAHCLEPQK